MSNQALANETMLSEARRLSRLMRQRRHTPLEDAVWLLEFVSATKGAGTCQMINHSKA